MVNQNDSQLDAIFFALADPTRRAMLDTLTKGDANVSELADPFSMSLPAISKHLTVLENAGLIVREKHGRVRQCHLQPEPLKTAAAWLSHYRAFWEGQFDALEEYLNNIQDDTKHPGIKETDHDGSQSPDRHNAAR
jgi:DNA-binding transcriptional ArsR family regulator